MTLPIVHMNGTSARDLTEGYVEAARAVDDAIDALAKHASPNGRDYYCSPDGNALDNALAEHRARLVKLNDVKTELNALALHCHHYIKP
jgi:hypothetical protein